MEVEGHRERLEDATLFLKIENGATSQDMWEASISWKTQHTHKKIYKKKPTKKQGSRFFPKVTRFFPKVRRNTALMTHFRIYSLQNYKRINLRCL